MNYQKGLEVVKNKKHILHFLPKKLEYLTESKKIEYQGKKLKTAYLISLVHKLVSKKYYNGEGVRKKIKVNLSSTILRESYGTFYNYYINYLIDKNVIKVFSKYFSGKKCNTYELNDEVFDGGVLRYKNTERFILKKWKQKRLEFEVNSLNDVKIIDTQLKRQLVNDLYCVDIDYEKASQSLLENFNSGDIGEVAYLKNQMSIESIKDGSIFYTEDKYGRFHTNYTILKKQIRNNYLSIDGDSDIVELDIKNSQPLFLSIFLKNNNFHVEHKEEYERFLSIVRSGKLYDNISEVENITRGDAKKLVYKTMFGSYKYDESTISKHSKTFFSMFPNVWRCMNNYKIKNKNKAIIAWELQKMESDMIFGNICKKLKREIPTIKIFTVHDSIFFQKKYLEKAESIFYNYIDLMFA